MEPVSITIAAAIAGGAAVALKDVANQAVEDAYQGLRTLIVDRYKRKASLEALEEDPESPAAQKLLAEALEKTKAVNSRSPATGPSLIQCLKPNSPNRGYELCY
jgi:hypothetical protein